VLLGEQRVATLMRRRDVREPLAWVSERVRPATEGIRGLLLAATGDHVVWVPLPFEPQDGAAVTLELVLDGVRKTAPLGTLDVRAGLVGLAPLRFEAVEEDVAVHGARLITRSGGFLADLVVEGDVAVERAGVFVGGQPALEGRIFAEHRSLLPPAARAMLLGRHGPRTVVSFQPLVSDYMCLRANAGEYVDLRTLEARAGTLVLSLDDGEREHRLPLLPFEIVERRGPLFNPRFASPIGVSDSPPPSIGEGD
jgi:hypothetical protein